jgi:hypothetical protein
VLPECGERKTTVTCARLNWLRKWIFVIFSVSELPLTAVTFLGVSERVQRCALEAGIGVWGIADWAWSQPDRPSSCNFLVCPHEYPQGKPDSACPSGGLALRPLNRLVPLIALIEHLFPPYTEEKVKALSQWFEY